MYFNNVSNINEARLIYRRLAMLNHPDMGGDVEVMKRINLEFDNLKKSLLHNKCDFKDLRVGDWVYVNGSKSLVVLVTRNTFTVKSEYTQRRATFYNSTGICVTNPKFRVERKILIKNVG